MKNLRHFFLHADVVGKFNGSDVILEEYKEARNSEGAAFRWGLSALLQR